MKDTPYKKPFGTLIASIGLLLCMEASAQDVSKDSGAALEEIVVTAQKRSESVQSAPVAITALSSDQLAKTGVTDIEGVAALVPNFNFGEYQGGAQLAIRGIGFDSVNAGGEGRVALHEDGVYLAQPSAGLNSFFDVNRVEVLRGPQGTLYGRNATGGAVNIVTNDPTEEFSGYYRQTFGNYNLITSEGAVSGGIAPGLSVRFAAQITDRKGYGEDIATASDIDNLYTHAVRGKVHFASGAFEWSASADYFRENDNGGGFHLFGAAVPGIPVAGLALGYIAPTNPRDEAADVTPTQSRTYWGLGSTETLRLTDSSSLKSITGYRSAKYAIDAACMPTTGNLAPCQIPYKSDTVSEEFQYAYETERIKAITGVYYFHSYESSGSTVQFGGPLFGLPPGLYQGYAGAGSGNTVAAAAFGELTYSFSSAFSVTVGERGGWERKGVNDYLAFDLTRLYSPNNPIIGATTQEAHVNNTYQTPKLSVNYQASDDVLLYATVAKGFKSGGFDIGSVAPAYKPESLWDYEVGFKSEWLQHRLRANIAAFYYDYKNLQVSFNNGVVNEIQNAASANLAGLEAEISALITNSFRIDFSGGYLHSEYRNYLTADPANLAAGLQDLTGRELIEAPKYSTRLSPEYRFDVPGGGSVGLTAAWKYRARVFFTAFNQDFNSAAPNSQYDITLDFRDASDRWTASLWGKNVTNQTVHSFSVTGASFFGFPVYGYLEPPATYGITAGYRF